MEEKLEIKISANFEGKGANEAKKAVENIGEAAKKSATSIDRLSKAMYFVKLSSVINVVKSFASALSSVTSSITNFFSEGVRLNAEFETMNSRLQSLIFTADKSANTDPFAKWQNSGEVAKKVIGDLKNLSNELGYNKNDLASMFSSFYSTASQSMDTDKAVEVFKKIAAAAKASGADVGSLKATLDSLGAGIIQTTTDFGRFASGLGLSTEKLKQAIAQGNFADVLIEAFAPFEDAAKMAEVTYDKIKTQFKATMDELKQVAAEPVFDALKQSFENLSNVVGNDGAMQDELRGLGEQIGKLINETLDPENIKSAIEALTALVDIVDKLIYAGRGLSDIAAPDWLFSKENAGLGDWLVAFNKGLEEVSGGFKSLMGATSNEVLRLEKEALTMANRVKFAFDEVGAVSWAGKFQGFKDGANESIQSVEKLRNSLLARQKELTKMLMDIKNLSFAEEQELIKNGTVAMLESDLERVRGTLTTLYQWQGIPKLQEEAKAAQLLADETARLKAEEQTRLETYLKANETRFKNYEKTIEKLMSEEEKLTQKLQDGISQREAIENAYNDKRAGISSEYDEKIRKSNQYNLSDSAKFALDMQQYTKSVLEAKKALEVGDLSGFERYLSLAKELSNAWADKSGKELRENEFDIVGIELYKKRLEELKALELSGTDEKEKKELAAHDEKMAQIQAELKATQDKITAEKAFYDEYTLKAKELQALLNTDTNSEHNINLNDSEAKAKIAELQKDTSSTHTLYVKEVRQSVEKKATGGLISGIFRRRRGKIHGHDLRGSDDVPALLTRGEFVQNVRAVDYYGTAFMEALNSRKIPREALPKLSSASLRSARNSPTGRFASFATGGLVLNKLDTNFIKQLTDSNQDVQELAKRLRQAFNNQAGGENASVLKKLAVAKQWEKMYPEHIKTNSRGYSFDFVGLAKAMIANSINGSALQNGELKAFSTGGMVAKNSTTKNVNLNLNFGGKNSFALQSDEATAAALERYLKGIGV